MERMAGVVIRPTTVVGILDEGGQQQINLLRREAEELVERESGVREEAAEVFVVCAKSGWSEGEVEQWEAGCAELRHRHAARVLTAGGARILLGASAGLTAEGTQPGSRERPPASSSALILRRISSREGLELRPFHREKKATAESSKRYTRRQSEEGLETAQCNANRAARSSSALICSEPSHALDTICLLY